MNRANQEIGQFGELLRRQYGFLANPSWPPWKNVERRLRDLGFEQQFGNRLGNMACHNLLTTLVKPPGTTSLLGLGLNFCTKEPTITTTTEHTYNRLIEDVRRIYHTKDATQEGAYNSALYIKSDYVFDPASDEVEQAVSSFRDAIQSEQLRRSRIKKPSRNLTPRQWNLVKLFKNNDKYIVVQGDKNLGPCIIERKEYILRGCKEHLGNKTNYQQLTKDQAIIRHRGLGYQFGTWMNKYRQRHRGEEPVDYECISEAEETYLHRARRRDGDRLARFRMTAKVHKTPWKTRPIVCCAGTWMIMLGVNG